MDTTMLNEDITTALHGRGYTDEQISDMGPDDAFDEYCMWNGLIHYGPRLRYVLERIRSAAR